MFRVEGRVNMRHLRHVFVFCVLVLFSMPQVLSALETRRPISAREVFALLPITIFENTVEGLSEGEKHRLLLDAQAEFWQLAEETEDSLLFSALPFHDSAVALRLFHETGGDFCLAAVGTIGEPLCTLEFWRIDKAGRIVPVDSPAEPNIKDFLDGGQILPRAVQPSVILCLDYDGLKARPLFWSNSGLVDLPVAYDIHYQWNGSGFERRQVVIKDR
jgi:hypothetical protein